MKRKNFLRKAIATATAVAAAVAPLAFTTQTVVAASITNFSNLMTRQQVSADSDHTITFTTPTGAAEDTDITVTFEAGFDLTALTIGDIDVQDDAVSLTTAADCTGAAEAGLSIAGQVITIEICNGNGGAIAADSEVTIAIGGTNQITNPATVDEYEITIGGTFGDTGIIEVPIIDDDTVNITGYIDTILSFDIDTSHQDEDCDAAGGLNACNSHSGSTDEAGYVVDLGEMSTLQVNKSGDNVLHADGNMGEINSIYFDLTTNADGGAIITVKSLYGALYKDATNAIPSVTNTGSGVAITAGDGAYGLRHVTSSADEGTPTIEADYNGAAGTYGEAATTTTTIFGTNDAPISLGRYELEVGATPNAMHGTGTYTDELTFIATSTF